MTALVKVLTDPYLNRLGLALFGVASGASLVSAVIVYYMEDAMKVSAALAGSVGGLNPILALLACPLAGKAYDRNRNASKLLFLSGSVMAIGISCASVATVYAAVLTVLLVGFCGGVGLTVGIAAAREVSLADKEYETLAVAWMNGLTLYAGFFSSIMFSVVVLRFNYAVAWLTAAAFAFILVSTVLFAKRS